MPRFKIRVPETNPFDGFQVERIEAPSREYVEGYVAGKYGCISGIQIERLPIEPKKIVSYICVNGSGTFFFTTPRAGAEPGTRLYKIAIDIESGDPKIERIH